MDERKGMAKGTRKETVELKMFLNQFKQTLLLPASKWFLVMQ
jgi:hypothetical protein